jgi:hypothetical protein
MDTSTDVAPEAAPGDSAPDGADDASAAADGDAS